MTLKPFHFLFIAALALCAPARGYDLPTSSGTHHVEYQADNAEYSGDEGRLHLEGHVLMKEKERPGNLPNRVIKAEDLTIYQSSHVAVSSGAITVEEGVNRLYGDDVFFNWQTKKGYLNNVSADMAPWRILHANTTRINDKKYSFTGTTFTSCNFQDPHYKIYASRLHIFPGEWMWGLNALFYIDKYPVFYLPIFYKPLGNDAKFVSYISFGYDKRSGYSISDMTLYRVNKNLLTRMYLDGYTKMSIGTGLGMVYDNKKDFNGSVDGYRIKEPGNPVQRWGLYGGAWNKLKDTRNTDPTSNGALYYWQTQFRMTSDQYFNNDYFRSNPYTVSKDRNASAALVRQTKFSTTRLSYSSQSQVLGNNNFYTLTQETLPRLEFNTAQFSVPKVPVLNTVTAYADRSLTTLTTGYAQTAGTRWTSSKAFPLGRGFSFVPSAYYDQSVTMHPVTADGQRDINQWIGRYGTNTNLRKDIAMGTVDLTYAFQRRLRANTLSADSQSTDSGIETNMLSLQTLLRPSTKFYGKMSSGYDFRFVEGSTVTAVYQRIQPIVAEALYTPTEDLNFFLRDYYQLGEGNQAFIVQTGFGKLDDNNMSIGFANYKTSPTNYVVNHRIQWYPRTAKGDLKTWHLDCELGYVGLIGPGVNLRTVALFEKKFTLYKNFHDFKTAWTVKIRPGVESFGVSGTLRFNTVTEQLPMKKADEKFSSMETEGLERH